VVFATTEPWLTGWQEVLGQTLRREIERVIANPLDVNRYQMEFYGVSRSVRGALKGRWSRFPAFSISSSCWNWADAAN
jgi:general secretion pathway protein E